MYEFAPFCLGRGENTSEVTCCVRGRRIPNGSTAVPPHHQIRVHSNVLSATRQALRWMLICGSSQTTKYLGYHVIPAQLDHGLSKNHNAGWEFQSFRLKGGISGGGDQRAVRRLAVHRLREKPGDLCLLLLLLFLVTAFAVLVFVASDVFPSYVLYFYSWGVTVGFSPQGICSVCDHTPLPTRSGCCCSVYILLLLCHAHRATV